jgi:hypothetical protein
LFAAARSAVGVIVGGANIMADEEEAGEEGKGGAVPWGLKKLAPGAAKVEAVRIPAAKRRVATLPAFLSLYGNGRANELRTMRWGVRTDDHGRQATLVRVGVQEENAVPASERGTGLRAICSCSI